jgi:hypothetical protein
MKGLLASLLIAGASLGLSAMSSSAHAQDKIDIKGIAVGAPVGDLPQSCRGSAQNGYTCAVDGQFSRMVVATTQNLEPNVVTSVGYRFDYKGELPKLVASISESYAVKLKKSGRVAGRPRYLWERPDGLRIDLEMESNTGYLTISKKALRDADARAAKEKKTGVALPKF